MTIKDHHDHHHDHSVPSAEQKDQLMAGRLSDKAYARQAETFHKLTSQYVNQQRRKFLDMVAKTGISSQILRSSSFVAGAMASRHALAAGGYAGKKLVIISLTQGAPGDQWLPSGPNSTLGVSRPYQDSGVAELMAFRQVNVINNGHSSCFQALGSPSIGIDLNKLTFDTKVAALLGATSPYQQMYLGAHALEAETRGEPSFLHRISTAGTPVDGPKATLERFFNLTQASKEEASAKLMIDAQRKNIAALKAKLGAEEQNRIQQHLDALATLENRLVSSSTAVPFNLAACSQANVDFGSDTLNQGYGQAQLIASALACGLTNVAVLQVGDNKYPYDSHSHSGSYSDFLATCKAQQTIPALMLKLLAETKGADGAALLDSTVFVVANDMGDGRSEGPDNSPWGMATRLPGFKTGFSAGNGGNCRDFYTAVAVGLGLPSGTYTDVARNPDAANILA